MRQNVHTLGVDVGKVWFHLIGLDLRGKPVFRRKIRREALLATIVEISPSLVGMEACPGSQFLARRLVELGVPTKLMAAQFVKPYLKSQKNDFNDAAAIAEAVRRPTMRFVPIKSQEQLDLQALHRYRERLIRDRQAATNQIRAFLQENGLTVAKGRPALRDALPDLLEDAENALSPAIRHILDRIRTRWMAIEECISEVDKEIKSIAVQRDDCRRLLTIPGLGPLNATALVAAIGNGREFKNGREVAAWLGLVPRQHSTGGQTRLLGVTKRGNPHLRRLLIHGARSVVLHTDRKRHRIGSWLDGLEARAHKNIAVVAMANKLARIAWAVLSKEAVYRPSPAPQTGQ